VQLPSFTVFTIIQIALHLKLHLAHSTLPFLCGYLPEQGASDPLLPHPSILSCNFDVKSLNV